MLGAFATYTSYIYVMCSHIVRKRFVNVATWWFIDVPCKLR